VKASSKNQNPMVYSDPEILGGTPVFVGTSSAAIASSRETEVTSNLHGSSSNGSYRQLLENG